jgi:ferredoxin-nitrite reductase
MVDWLVESQRCPGLFYGTPAQDGYILRIRIPGGSLSQVQGMALAQICQDALGGEILQITNRANLQFRALNQAPSLAVWQQLQSLGLAAQNPQLDHLRNLMASPTAGIDLKELLDTRPLVQQLDALIQSQPTWTALPAKFSIGVDGGGKVGLGTRSQITWEHRNNDLQFTAQVYQGKVYLRLALAGHDTQSLVAPDDCLNVVAALVQVYLEYIQLIDLSQNAKPRLRQLINDWGLSSYLERVNQHLAQPLQPNANLSPLPSTEPYAHLGQQQQQQAGRVYLGVSLTLGQLTVHQLVGLLDLAKQYGTGELRLTPWQTILLPNIDQTQVGIVFARLSDLALIIPGGNFPGFPAQIVACAGLPSCASAVTHTQAHALALAASLPATRYPVNIHVTGCAKGCAQPSPADITLLGTTLDLDTVEGYRLYSHSQGLSVRQLAEQPPHVTLAPHEMQAMIGQLLAPLKIQSQAERP